MEFEHVGDHCDVKTCRQKDFLPFTCDCCDGTFCLEHRSYRTHECPKAASRDTVAITCPLCAKSFKLACEEDANVAWERHSKSGCDPKGRKTRTKKPRCGVKGCRTKLVFSNKHHCSDCGLDTCLDHRFGDAHGCAERKAANRSSWMDRLTSRARSAGGGGGAGGSGRSAPRAKPKTAKARAAKRARLAAADAANTLRGTAERRRAAAERARGTPSAPSAQATIVAPPALPTPARPEPLSREAIAMTRGSEVCPTCSARFGTVEELVSHVTAYHESTPAEVAGTASGTGSAGAGREVCPQCGERFGDAIQLVGHVEAVHRRAQVEEERRSCCVS